MHNNRNLDEALTELKNAKAVEDFPEPQIPTDAQKKYVTQHVQSLIDRYKSNPSFQPGEISDGYHTFNELYDHRIMLFIGFAKAYCKLKRFTLAKTKMVWKSKRHSDDSSFDGWFVMGIGESKGEQITYHLPNRYWNHCDFAMELLKAPEFDGHSSKDVLQRLEDLIILEI